jgi:hypothetical protein
MKPSRPQVAALACLLAAFAVPATSAPISHVMVRIVTGAQPLSPTSDLELRIYEVGGRVRRLPLAHGEIWGPDSTRLIPVSLSEPLDPRVVVRYGIYYRSALPESPAWEITDADVELPSPGDEPLRLLDTSVSGVIVRQGELSSFERSAGSMECLTDSDCDDHRSCNGLERCAPRAAGADARGCVKGKPLVCPVNEVCTEQRGCMGTASLGKSGPPAAASPR